MTEHEINQIRAPLRETSLGDYLEAVSSSMPTPGGGSVAAVVAALSAALGSMVTAISTKKSDNDQITTLAAACSGFRETFLRLSAEDQSAFEHGLTKSRPQYRQLLKRLWLLPNRVLNC